MATISQNQKDYLDNLVAGGGGNAEWAKAQLAGATVEPAKPTVASTPTTTVGTSTPKTSSSSPSALYSIGTPSTSAPSNVSYTTPSSTYSGAANVIGNVSGNNSNQAYQNVYDSYRAANPGTNAISSYTDPSGNVYNTTTMTPQQVYALQLAKSGNTNAATILKGMGLDINGNPNFTSFPTFNVGGDAIFRASSTPQLTSSQQSAQDWINNADSGQGGVTNYINQQISRFNDAVASGDRDLISRLQQDANRVGYSLPNSTYTTQSTGTTGATGTGQQAAGSGTALTGDASLRKSIEDQVKARNDAQILAINQGLASANQGYGLAQAQNQNALNEGIADINKQDAVSRQIAQELQNRRGGFYSGGLDYQLGSQASAATDARSGLQRDIGARQADITGKIALNNQQAADKISLINQSAPGEIQQLVDSALAARAEKAGKEKQQRIENAIKTAGVTGYYNDPEVQDIFTKMNSNSDAWFNASPQERQRLAAENQQLGASIGAWQDENGDWQPPQPTPTLAREKQQYDQAYQKYRDDIKDEQYWAKFDQDERQWGLEFAADQAYKQGQLNIQQRNAAISEAREARLSESANSGNSEGSSKSKPASEINLIGDDLLKKYGKVTYDSNKQPKYSYPENEDKQAEAVLEILNLNYNDSDTLKLLNKLGITEARAHELLGEG